MNGKNDGVVSVKIRVTVEVIVPSVWGSECTLDQVMKAGEREGPMHLIAAFKASGSPGDFTMVGQPEVLATVVRRKP